MDMHGTNVTMKAGSKAVSPAPARSETVSPDFAERMRNLGASKATVKFARSLPKGDTVKR